MSKIINPNAPTATVGSKMQQLEARQGTLEVAVMQLRNTIAQLNMVIGSHDAIFSKALEKLGVNLQEVAKELNTAAAEAQGPQKEDSSKEEKEDAKA